MAQRALIQERSRYVNGAHHRPLLPSEHSRHLDVAICDRDPDSRAIYSDFLRHHGVAVETFESVAELSALPVAPSLIVLDHAEAVEDALRRVPNTPLLVLSSWCFAHDRIAAIAAGADGFLPKPSPLNEVLRSVVALLRR